VQLHSNAIPFPCDADDDTPCFFGWRWARGAITVTLEGFDDVTDGQTMLTFSPEVDRNRQPHGAGAVRRTEPELF
jgi:hypothetical protein